MSRTDSSSNAQDIPTTTVSRRRREILTASAELFREDGFHAVGIDRIGEAVGISGPAIYRYFPNKESLLVALFDDVTARLTSTSKELRARITDPQSQLEALIDFQLQFAQQEPTLIAVYRQEARHLPREHHVRLGRRMRQYIQDWTEPLGRLRPDLSSIEQTAVVRLVIGLIDSSATFESSLPSDALARRMHQMALGALLRD